MQVPRAGLALVVVALVAAACSGTPAGSTPGAGGPTPGPQATQGPAATQGSAATQPGGGDGSKPAGWDANGKAHFEISGSVSKSGDLGFVPVASVFTGTTGPTSLAFTIEKSQEVLTILITEGQVAVSSGDAQMALSGVQCTSSNLRVDATSGSGSFDCPQTVIVKSDGTSVTGVRISGTFDARK